jgi:ABC-type branched-subunit amino acid transport system ATPase component
MPEPTDERELTKQVGRNGAATGHDDRAVALAVRDFSCGYQAVPVVDHVSLQVRHGQVVAVLGPNGAGKSTLLKGVMGLNRRMGGSVHLGEREVTRMAPESLVAAGISYVPQVDNVFPNLSVDENLRMGAFLNPASFRARRQEVVELLPALGEAARRKAGTLSGGQRNMLALGRALMLEPKVLLLDEPTAGLAPAIAAEVWRNIRRVAQTGAAILVVEQNVDFALQGSDHVYVLVSGKNRLDMPSAQAIGNDALGAAFMGR